MIIFGGIDFPVFEMLFVISVLLIVGLTFVLFGIWYILKEIRALNALLLRERSDIVKFESDLTELEKLESGKNDAEAITQYIKRSLGAGQKWEHIKYTLVKSGIEPGKADKLYKKLK